jgi:hypothetical protein
VLMMETWYFDGGVRTRDTSPVFAFLYLLHGFLGVDMLGKEKWEEIRSMTWSFSAISCVGNSDTLYTRELRTSPAFSSHTSPDV